MKLRNILPSHIVIVLVLMVANAGCMNSSSDGGNSLRTDNTGSLSAARELYVTNNGTNTVSTFDDSLDGNIHPLKQIGNVTGLNDPAGVAVDTVHEEIFVANYDSITVYSRTGTGNSAPVRTVSGAITGLSAPSGIAVDTANNEIFVVNWSNSITVYTRTANGNIAPLRTISGASTGLSGPIGIAVDTVHGEIYVANSAAITVYDRTGDGNVAPIRTITGASTGLNYPSGIAVDMVNGELFVTNHGTSPASITIFSRVANGNIAPIRTISGTNTGLGGPYAIAVDTVNNEIAVADAFVSDSLILVYDRTANGDSAPIRTISGTNTGMGNPYGVAVDMVNDEIVVINDYPYDSITVYDRIADGNIAPVRTISVASAGLAGPSGIAVDKAHNEIFVASTTNSSIQVYSRADNGDLALIRTIAGASTGLSYPSGIAVDTANNEIFVVNGSNSITVYTRTADGDNSPIRTISNSSLYGLSGIALDTANDEIYVTNYIFDPAYNFNSVSFVTVYSRTANGNAAPIRTIKGTNTGLDYPYSIAIDTVNNELFVGNLNNSSICVFDTLADGNIAPRRTIINAAYYPLGIAVDIVTNELFVTDTWNSSIMVYSRTAHGNVAPRRTISGADTGLSDPFGIALW